MPSTGREDGGENRVGGVGIIDAELWLALGCFGSDVGLSVLAPGNTLSRQHGGPFTG